MVPCKLCSSLGGMTEFSTLDEQKTHAQFHHFQLGYFNSEDSDRTALKETFAKCFPSEDFEKPKKLIGKGEEIEKSRSTLLEVSRCITLAKKNKSNSIECQMCDSNVSYMNGKVMGADRILVHACYHSSKKAFRCRQECQHISSSKWDIVKHVKLIHKIGSPIAGVHFDEDWADCFDEVKESLTKCFGDVVWALLPSTKNAQRRSIFKNILKSAIKDKKIRCNQCPQEISTYQARNLEQHLYTHLQRRIYECVMCDHSSIHKRTIETHSATEHGVSSGGQLYRSFGRLSRGDYGSVEEMFRQGRIEVKGKGLGGGKMLDVNTLFPMI